MHSRSRPVRAERYPVVGNLGSCTDVEALLGEKRGPLRPVAASTKARLSGFQEPLLGFVRFSQETTRLSDLYTTGADRLRNAHELQKILFEHDKKWDLKPDEGQLERAKELSALARAEVEAGFPLVNAHFLLGVWGVFESALDACVVEWMVQNPGDFQWGPQDEIKMSPAVVFAPDARARAEVFLEALKKRRGSAPSVGITRFEGLLSLVGLDGPLPAGLSDTVFELQQVRNIYAHNGGQADPRFLAACPYVPVKLGERVPVNPRIADGYYSALLVYANVILARGWARHGIGLHNHQLCWRRGLTAEQTLGELLITVDGQTPLKRHIASESMADA